MNKKILLLYTILLAIALLPIVNAEPLLEPSVNGGTFTWPGLEEAITYINPGNSIQPPWSYYSFEITNYGEISDTVTSISVDFKDYAKPAPGIETKPIPITDYCYGIETLSCTIPNVLIKEENVEVNISIVIANETKTQTYSHITTSTFTLDNTRPEVGDITLEGCEGETCYVASNTATKIIVQMEDQIGTFNRGNINLRIGNEKSTKSLCEGKTCSATITTGTCTDGSDVTIGVQGAPTSWDDAGNYVHGKSETAICDSTKPVLDESSITLTSSKGIPTYKEGTGNFIGISDDVTLEFTVTEASSPSLKAELNLSEFNQENVQAECTPLDETTFNCKVGFNIAIDEPENDMTLPIVISDLAGNTITYNGLEVDLLIVSEGEPLDWKKVTTENVIKANQHYLQFVNKESLITLTFVKNLSTAKLIDVQEMLSGECTQIKSESEDYVKFPTVLHYEIKSFGNNHAILMATLPISAGSGGKGGYADMHEDTGFFSCPIKVLTIRGDSFIASAYEEENFTIEVRLHNSSTIGGNLYDEVQILREKTEKKQENLETLKTGMEWANRICGGVGIPRAISGALSTASLPLEIVGLKTFSAPLIKASKNINKLYENPNNPKTEILKLVSDLCKFATCDLAGSIEALNNIGEGKPAYEKGESSEMTRRASAEASSRSDGNDPSDWQVPPEIRDGEGDTAPEVRPQSSTEESFFEPEEGSFTDWALNMGGKSDLSALLDPYSSVIIAGLTLCPPALIYHTEQSLSIQCGYADCLTTKVLNGQSTIENCQEMYAMDQCVKVTGAFVNILPLSALESLTKELVELATDPIAVFGMFGTTALCALFDKIPGSKVLYVACSALTSIEATMNLIVMGNNVWNQFQFMTGLNQEEQAASVCEATWARFDNYIEHIYETERIAAITDSTTPPIVAIDANKQYPEYALPQGTICDTSNGCFFDITDVETGLTYDVRVVYNYDDETGNRDGTTVYIRGQEYTPGKNIVVGLDEGQPIYFNYDDVKDLIKDVGDIQVAFMSESFPWIDSEGNVDEDYLDEWKILSGAMGESFSAFSDSQGKYIAAQQALGDYNFDPVEGVRQDIENQCTIPCVVTVNEDDNTMTISTPTGQGEFSVNYDQTTGQIEGSTSNSDFAVFFRPPELVVKPDGVYYPDGTKYEGGGDYNPPTAPGFTAQQQLFFLIPEDRGDEISDYCNGFDKCSNHIINNGGKCIKDGVLNQKCMDDVLSKALKKGENQAKRQTNAAGRKADRAAAQANFWNFINTKYDGVEGISLSVMGSLRTYSQFNGFIEETFDTQIYGEDGWFKEDGWINEWASAGDDAIESVSDWGIFNIEESLCKSTLGKKHDDSAMPAIRTGELLYENSIHMEGIRTIVYDEEYNAEQVYKLNLYVVNINDKPLKFSLYLRDGGRKDYVIDEDKGSFQEYTLEANGRISATQTDLITHKTEDNYDELCIQFHVDDMRDWFDVARADNKIYCRPIDVK